MVRLPGEGPYEKGDVSLRGVLAAIGLIAAIVVLSALGLYGLRGWLVPDRPAPPPILGRLDRGGPPLTTAPRDRNAALLQEHRDRLTGYAWIDRDAGVARIPIGRAMDILADRGWQTPPPERPPTAMMPQPLRRTPPEDTQTP